MTGIVTKSTGSWYWVRTQNHMQYKCRIRGKFRIKGIKSTNPVTVGDHVDFDLELNSDTGIINNIHDRKNYIVRKSVKLSKQTHIIAANIDLAFLIITVDHPPTFTSFIDRFLATAEAYHIEVVLLFNKIDLYDDLLNKKKEKLLRIYRNIGYNCLEISATEKINTNKVKNLMLGKISMFSGHSGVGKSTLINIIAPELKLKTAKVSSQHKQGQHTTTFAEMFVIDTEPESYIIDTPGIKGFGVVDFEQNETGDYFREFFKLKNQCKFNNCLHVNEPNCAVKNALEKNLIAPSRYKNYLQLLNGEDEVYRTNKYEF
jgi:ribosome biogenesis GTPase